MLTPLTSKFNSKGLWQELVLFLLAPLTLMTFSLSSKWAAFVTIVMTGVVLLIALCIWAYRLKTITVTDQGLEVKRTCLPFLKRFYRLAEFDSYVVEQEGISELLHLLCQGQRVVTLSSKIYENYAELKEALSVVGLKEWGTDASRAVDSVFKKSHLAGVFVMLFFVLFGVGIPVSNYFEHGQVDMKIFILFLIYELVFLPLFLYALSESKRFTIWRGHLEVRSTLCPWKTEYYALNDFDSALKVIVPETMVSEEKSLWLVRNGKLALSISPSVYANYDVLEHAIGIVPSRTISMSMVKKLRYYLGKTINNINI